MSQGKRAWGQFIESTFVVCVLLVALECVLPVLQQQMLDWHQVLFTCVFGGLVVLSHTVAAYVRHAPIETVAPSPARIRLRQWAPSTIDATWQRTAPNMPVYQPSQMGGNTSENH